MSDRELRQIRTRLDDLTDLVEEVLVLLRQLLRKDHTIMRELDDLALQVAAVNTIEESAVKLINGLVDRLNAAGTDPAKIATLTASLKAQADKLAAAVSANTTSVPDTAPVPDPAPAPANP